MTLARVPAEIHAAAIVGFGKAGGSLAHSLTASGVLVHVASRQEERRRRAPSVVRGVVVETPTRLLASTTPPNLDVLFLAVPDAHIESVAQGLLTLPVLPPLVAHLSGARGREALAALASRVHIASFHPLAALDGHTPIPPRTLLAIDGDVDVAKSLSALATLIGGRPATIAPDAHARYHAGAVLAGNLPVALIADAMELFASAGVDDDVAREGLARLLESTAKALQRGPLPKMLTGPIARNDAATVTRHLDAIDDDAIRERYKMLSRRLLDVAPLDDSARNALATLLASSK